MLRQVVFPDTHLRVLSRFIPANLGREVSAWWRKLSEPFCDLLPSLTLAAANHKPQWNNGCIQAKVGAAKACRGLVMACGPCVTPSLQSQFVSRRAFVQMWQVPECRRLQSEPIRNQGHIDDS